MTADNKVSLNTHYWSFPCTVVNVVNGRPVSEIMHNSVSLSGRSRLADRPSSEWDHVVYTNNYLFYNKNLYDANKKPT